MDTQRQEEWQEAWWVWAIVAGLVLGGVLWLAFASSSESGGLKPPTGGPGTHQAGVSIGTSAETVPHADKLTALEKYNAWIEGHTPTVDSPTYRDLADGSSAVVPSVNMHDNYVGGEATDMMALTMGLDERDARRPVPGKQEWELKTFTFPQSRATYMEIDLMPAGQRTVPQAEANMRGWDLAQLCPALAAVDERQWTQDERQYVHYLTKRQMGFDGTETGFSALWAAYASNFALWKGEPRTVPAAAYYALAAAHFEADLAGGGPPSARATAVTWMVCGECHRLLGRLDDATRCFDAAQQLADQLDAAAAKDGARVDTLRPAEKQVLALYHKLAADGNNTLQRQPYTGVPEPPIGWYIDYLLSAINGDLAVERAEWAALRDPQAICAAINARIAARRGPVGRQP